MIAAERGAAKNTLEAYRRDLEHYAEFLAGCGTDALGVGTAVIRTYLARLETAGLKASSSARGLSALRPCPQFL